MKLNIEELLIQVPDDLKETETFEAFARLIVERCAVEAEKLSPHPDEYSDQSEYTEKRVALGCASAIRKLLEAG